jgi:hypothetical protein
MLKCHKGMSIPTVEQTLSVLQGNINHRPIYVDYDKVLMNIFSLNEKIEKADIEFQNLTGEINSSKNALLYYIDRNGLGKYFDTTKSGNISLNAESIANACNMIDDEYGEHIEVLNLYSKISEYQKARGCLVPMLQNPISDLYSCDGHRMLEIRPQWSSQNTGRVAMSKPAIQNINRELQEVLTCPAGFKLLHTDSGQVEPRITYSAIVPDPQIKALIELYDDAYFGLLHYCTMPVEFIHSGTTNFQKMEITDTMKENRSKIKRYGNAVMYGSKKVEDNIKAAMIERIGNHPIRLQLISQIRDELRRGNRIFKTYFGTPIDISKSPKLLEQGRDTEEELIKLAINNPIQGTAADLMRYSCIQANRYILSTKKSSIVCYIHDAGIFCVAEDEWDQVGKELSDIVSYEVDDWVPVHAEADIYEFKPNAYYANYKY